MTIGGVPPNKPWLIHSGLTLTNHWLLKSKLVSEVKIPLSGHNAAQTQCGVGRASAFQCAPAAKSCLFGLEILQKNGRTNPKIFGILDIFWHVKNMNMAIYADKGDLAIKQLISTINICKKPRLLHRLFFFFRFRKDVYYPAILLGRISQLSWSWVKKNGTLLSLLENEQNSHEWSSHIPFLDYLVFAHISTGGDSKKERFEEQRWGLKREWRLHHKGSNSSQWVFHAPGYFTFTRKHGEKTFSGFISFDVDFTDVFHVKKRQFHQLSPVLASFLCFAMAAAPPNAAWGAQGLHRHDGGWFLEQRLWGGFLKSVAINHPPVITIKYHEYIGGIN